MIFKAKGLGPFGTEWLKYSVFSHLTYRMERIVLEELAKKGKKNRSQSTNK